MPPSDKGGVLFPKKSGSGKSSATGVILPDGRSLRIRPVRQGDEERLEEFFYALSPRARYLRFHHQKSQIGQEELAHLADVQPPRRSAHVATVGEGEQEQIIGVGRYDATDTDGSVAELAFAVADKMQARGIETVLLDRLTETATRYRIKRFVAQVVPENTALLEVFEDSGFKVSKRLEEGVYHYTLDLEEQEEFATRQAHREHIARSTGVRRMLAPRSVAVVGASRNPEGVSGAVFRNLLQAGFNGTIFPVNPNAASVSGVLAYPTVLDVPADVDLAVIVVPAERVLEVVEQCGEKGVRGLLIISAGFGEAGEDGKERERILRDRILAYGMRLIGPNCLGVMNLDPQVMLNATFAPFRPSAGNVSIGTQSGALGLALLDHVNNINLGLSHFVSIGNQVDISTGDLLEFWEDDDNTGIILLYVESFGNPREFATVARRLAKKKPIVAVKSGRSSVGARAASSHTGALAATDVAVEAMFKEAGVVRVNTIEEMFNVAAALAHQPVPRGPRVGILTNAGGPGVMAADACEGWGLTVPILSQETQTKLREFLPREASVSNPVDMIASAPAESYKHALSIMLEDSGLDSVLLIYIPPLVTHPEEVAAAIRDTMSPYEGDKPVLACFMMARGATMDLRIDSRRYVPSFTFPEDAVHALGRAYQYSVFRNQPEGRIPRFPEIDPGKARNLVGSFEKPGQGEAWLPPELTMGLLKEYGIPVVETKVSHTAEEAARQSQELGFPVVMKIVSSTIVHKSDVGGVVLGLESSKQVEDAFEQMRQRLDVADRSEEMQGVVLQPMLKGGQEMIIGMSQDPVFGPMVMVGLGGIYVEVTGDVAFSLHPLRDVSPDRMLGQLKGLPILKGWRGNPPKDLDSVKDVLLRFSALLESFPEIVQAEMNPLLVFGEGLGCSVVDARIMLKGTLPSLA